MEDSISKMKDLVIRTAWQQFDDYDRNAARYQKRFLRTRILVLCLGVIAAILAVTNSYFRGETYKEIHGYIHIPVVILPLLTSILLSFAAKFNSGKAWVACRVGAETTKKEIFRRRVGIEMATENGEDSRLFRQRLCDIVERVNDMAEGIPTSSACSSSKSDCQREMPPKKHLFGGDDGYCDLGAEEYLAYRLTPQREWYESRSRKFHKIDRRLHWAFYILGGIGTGLAAFGLDPWVAVSTAGSAAFITYSELRRNEYLSITYARVAVELKYIEADLKEISAGTQTMEGFQQLVASSEAIISREHTAWIKTARKAQQTVDQKLREEIDEMDQE